MGNGNYMRDFGVHARSGSVVWNFKFDRMCLSSYDSIRESIKKNSSLYRNCEFFSVFFPFSTLRWWISWNRQLCISSCTPYFLWEEAVYYFRNAFSGILFQWLFSCFPMVLFIRCRTFLFFMVKHQTRTQAELFIFPANLIKNWAEQSSHLPFPPACLYDFMHGSYVFGLKSSSQCTIFLLYVTLNIWNLYSEYHLYERVSVIETLCIVNVKSIKF